MDLSGKRFIITGGSHGIGKGLAEALHAEGVVQLFIADLDEAAGQSVADTVGGVFVKLDVSDESAVAKAIQEIETNHGPIDGLFSNAGIMYTDGPTFTAYGQSTEQWQKVWAVNVLAHVHFARALMPHFLNRGAGLFVITASAAGLLNQMGDAAYSTTKHAAVGYAESLAITHGDDGVQVSVLCPQAVESNMTKGAAGASATLDGMLSAAEMAKRSLVGIKAGQFMIRPHPEVEQYYKNKAENYDRWVGGMRKLRRMQLAVIGKPL